MENCVMGRGFRGKPCVKGGKTMIFLVGTPVAFCNTYAAVSKEQSVNISFNINPLFALVHAA
jgi:hypothetical protein